MWQKKFPGQSTKGRWRCTFLTAFIPKAKVFAQYKERELTLAFHPDHALKHTDELASAQRMLGRSGDPTTLANEVREKRFASSYERRSTKLVKFCVAGEELSFSVGFRMHRRCFVGRYMQDI